LNRRSGHEAGAGLAAKPDPRERAVDRLAWNHASGFTVEGDLRSAVECLRLALQEPVGTGMIRRQPGAPAAAQDALSFAPGDLEVSVVTTEFSR